MSKSGKGGTVGYVVPLGFSEGERFSSFEEFNTRFKEACQANNVGFFKRSVQTIEAAKRKVNHSFRPELKYYYVRYKCVFSRVLAGKGQTPSMTKKVLTACPAAISIHLRTTDVDQFLQVVNVEWFHNHPVSKKAEDTDSDIDNIIEGSPEYENYRAVLAKGERIAKLAAVSDNKRFQEILKNLDDLIFYLKCFENEDEENLELTKNNTGELRTY
ncbi:unnamed protein product [Ceutorhynchus assimilis]|uniref:ZSWIM3 N-terminal domain-containing protein n=1 Tax=Ceutorhynchus assimilis TaxID=467358 RepID=A0A9N9QJZ4_9CUCU|nr:unnamed protein product [Ceutorhynchus assimilis]